MSNYIRKTLLSTPELLLSKFKQIYQVNNIYAFFNSEIDLIVTQKHFMLLPIDDRIFNTSHGVFTNLYIKSNQKIKLQNHIARLQSSAKALEIQMPFPSQKISQKIFDICDYTCKITKDENIGVRIWVSSGRGDFGLTSIDKKSILYIATYKPFISKGDVLDGVNQFLVQKSKFPKLSTFKTTNYILSSLIANQAQRKNCYQGIKISKDGIVLEATLSNIGIFTKDNIFAIPRFQTILKDITLTKCFNHLKENSCDLVNQIEQRDIHYTELFQCKEIMLFGGDKIVPVLKIDDHEIRKQKGPLCSYLQEWYSLN